MNLTQKAKWVRKSALERAKRWVSRCETKGPNKTLVIIDMQEVFIRQSKHDLDLTSLICELIRHARQQRWAIILVEYDSFDSTVKEIIEALKDYPYQETVIKSCNDGGEKIIECIRNKKTWSLDLMVCGLYGDQCVAETVQGLFDNSNEVLVDVVADAVWPPYSSSSKKNEQGQQQEREVSIKEIGITAK